MALEVKRKVKREVRAGDVSLGIHRVQMEFKALGLDEITKGENEVWASIRA